MLPDNHESLLGFIAKDMKKKDVKKGKDKKVTTHTLLFNDGASIQYYVDYNDEAKEDKKHIYLRSADVYLVSEGKKA